VSGPVNGADGPPTDAAGEEPTPPTVERRASRTADVGGTPVRRALPTKGRRTIGAWCFVDHFGPAGGTGPGAMGIGPHPHIGLHTVTWLLEGEVLHTDSLGSEQLIRPGQLNLMTAGRGVAHAEQTPTAAAHLRQHGAQLWVAQPDTTRHGDPAFEHHAELPEVELGPGLSATVVLGAHDDVRSPARTDWPLLGLVVRSDERASADVALDPSFEHGVVVLDGRAEVAGEEVAPGELAYLGEGREALEVRTAGPATLLLLGGEPFVDELLMWWNYVARTRAEVEQASEDWRTGDPRFGPVRSELDRIDAPPIPWSNSR
jgi:redox-sensitive bicupin YhaK (pirin superfamily)